MVLFRPVCADVILLSDIPGSAEPYVSGNKEEAGKKFSPGSTFKMILALVAFEQKIATPETRLLCVGRNVPPKPVPLTFQQAMFESNNDFFVQLIAKLTDEQILEMAQRCGFGEVATPAVNEKKEEKNSETKAQSNSSSSKKTDNNTKSDDGRASEPKTLVKNRAHWVFGGPIRVTPEQEHDFLRRLIRGHLPVEKQYQRDLLQVMKWPAVRPGIDVYGKTGSWEKTYWFSGLAVKQNTVRTITVTLTTPGTSRARAVQRFYQQIDRSLTAPEPPETKKPQGTPNSEPQLPPNTLIDHSE